jgi:hypothetical protein
MRFIMAYKGKKKRIQTNFNRLNDKESARLESDLTWFLEKFKDSEDWISARDIARKYIRKSGQDRPMAEYFRGLMVLAVGRSKATPNEYPHTHSKYKIRLVAHKPIDRFFDSVILSHPLIINLPPREYLKMNLTVEQHYQWNAFKSLWILIYKALCRHQNGQGIEDFSKEWNPVFFDSREGLASSKYISLKAHFFILTYKLLKIGWQEIEKECPNISLIFSTYNDAFLVLLRFDSKVRFKQCFKDTFYRPRSRYEHLYEILLALKDEELLSGNHKHYERLVRFSGAPAEDSNDAIQLDFARGLWIEEALKNSTNPDVQEALRVWKESELAIWKNTLSELNYERNLRRND